MSSNHVRTEYPALGDAANRFDQEAERVGRAAQNLSRGVDTLRHNNWVGVGADAFYKEIDTEVLPTFGKLEKALEQASQVLKAIGKLFRDAEQQGTSVVGKISQTAQGGLAGALGGLAGGAAGALGGAAGAAAGGDALAALPNTLQGLLQNAIQGLGLNQQGQTITIQIQGASGMPSSGMQYGMANPAAAGTGGGVGGGAGAGAGGTPPTTPQPQTPTGGGGGGGDSGFGSGGSPYGGGSSMQMGSAGGAGAGQPGTPGYWFGATVGTHINAANVASLGVGAAPPAPGGNAIGSLLAEIGATAGAAVLGVVGKAVIGKGALP